MGSISSQDLTRVIAMMTKSGVRRIYFKPLASNDNSKNQVYLGPDFSALNILPVGSVRAERDPASGRTRFKSSIAMSWLSDDGGIHPAPQAQLILYPQYPEVRLSGFLLGCDRPPSETMASRDENRVLVLGVCDDATIIAYAARPDSPAARELLSLGLATPVGVFFEIASGPAGHVTDHKARLIQALTTIHRKGWIDSKRLRPDGTAAPCDSQNCGGYTLEAELEIVPNGIAEPDYLGWEIKQHAVRTFDRIAVGVLTLMTPEPTGGLYKELGIDAFVRRFGYPDRAGRADRLNFGGIYRVGRRVPSTSLTLVLLGFEPISGQIVDATAGISLLTDHGDIAAQWQYASIMKHWNRKHALAAYLPSQRRSEPNLQYRYGPRVRLGEKTDFLRFLAALASGRAYYDPGIKLEGVASGRPVPKRRSQFRIPSADLPCLYEQMETVDLDL